MWVNTCGKVAKQSDSEATKQRKLEVESKQSKVSLLLHVFANRCSWSQFRAILRSFFPGQPTGAQQDTTLCDGLDRRQTRAPGVFEQLRSTMASRGLQSITRETPSSLPSSFRVSLLLPISSPRHKCLSPPFFFVILSFFPLIIIAFYANF